MSVSPGSPWVPPALPRRYTVRRKLGAGSFGTVYLADDSVRRREVALKVLRLERLTESASSSLQAEFRAIASIRHPRIAAAYDFGYAEDGRLPFYTREHVPGVPLPPGPPVKGSPVRFLEPVLDLLDALAFLHAHGMLHLDIHPGNLILADDPRGGGVLIDLAPAWSPAALARATTSAGTAAPPPELLRGGKPTARTDIFLAGRLLQYRLTGRAGGRALLPAGVPEWPPRLLLELERIIAMALQEDPARRFASAEALGEALEDALGAPTRRRLPMATREAIVGRESEIEAIEEKLRDLAAGKPGLLIFGGHEGLGKSRLLAEARVRAQLRGFEVVEGGGLRQEGPGSSLVGSLRKACAGPLGGGGWLDPLDARHGGTPAERSRRAAEAYFLAPGKPLVIIADDLDRAERGSRDLVEALGDQCSRRAPMEPPGRALLIVGSLSGAPPSGSRPAGYRRLRPLGSRAARALFLDLLQPLEIGPALVSEAIRCAGGSPLLLRRIAIALRRSWDREGVLPGRIIVPRGGPARAPWLKPSPGEHEAARAIAIAARPVTLTEITAVLRLPSKEVRRTIRQLEKDEVIVAGRAGRETLFQLGSFPGAEDLARGCPARISRDLHRRYAAHLRARPRRGAWEEECLARHLIASRKSEGSRVALQAARLLRKEGSLERALRMLEHALAFERAPSHSLELAEELSAVAGDLGDHEAAVAALEPLCAKGIERFSRAGAARLLRRLGVHHHRAGKADRALHAFEEARRRADPLRSLEDLVHIESELAEMDTLQGRHEAAEEACRRGLDLLRLVPRKAPFRRRMEVMLRASLGHLRLRRMDLPGAREELEAALRLCAPGETSATRVTILNNLGIVANQANDYARARESFGEAERLLVAAGERRGAIEVACNLAVLEAKLGEREKASFHIEEAARLHAEYPGKRLDFFVPYARGIAAHLLGDFRKAIEALDAALPAGRDLGDRHLVGYGEVYLAEAHLLSGHYRRSAGLLRGTARDAARAGLPLLLRMAEVRKGVLEALLGRAEGARRSLGAFEAVPRTGVRALEAWNDLFAGVGRLLLGEDGEAILRSAMGELEELGLEPGARLARAAVLAAALARASGAARPEEKSRIARLLEMIENDGATAHRFLAVAEPLLAAEGALAIGDPDMAERPLEAAGVALVGSSLLELDLRIELLRARLASIRGEAQEARRHLDRSIHTRDLLGEHVPARALESFLAHGRFRAIAEADIRLRRAPGTPRRGGSSRRAPSYEGMVGRSSPMVRLFRAIERIADAKAPILLTGETGTGKDLAARAIHERSSRSAGPFVVLGCPSIPEGMLESELFGALAGAYTGVDEDRPGLLDHARGGTLFLDEVSSLSLEAQAKLLRVLDAGSFRSLGASEERKADVRFLASTSTSLEEACEGGRFRRDLYYRLRSIEVRLPPLRERKEDILHLARHFLSEHARRLGRPTPELSADALALLEEHSWPGNVRELEGALFRALVSRSGGNRIAAADLEPHLSRRAGQLFDDEVIDRHALKDLKTALERQYLTRLFLRSSGDLDLMTKSLGVKRTRLYIWMRRLGINVRELRGRLRRGS